MQQGKLYYVLPADMAKQLDFDSLEEIRYEYVRKSVDETLAIVEYKGSIQVRGGSYYTYEEALALMQTPEWYAPDESLF